jgi:hypothetical protein
MLINLYCYKHSLVHSSINRYWANRGTYRFSTTGLIHSLHAQQWHPPPLFEPTSIEFAPLSPLPSMPPPPSMPLLPSGPPPSVHWAVPVLARAEAPPPPEAVWLAHYQPLLHRSPLCHADLSPPCHQCRQPARDASTAIGHHPTPPRGCHPLMPQPPTPFYLYYMETSIRSVALLHPWHAAAARPPASWLEHSEEERRREKSKKMEKY